MRRSASAALFAFAALLAADAGGRSMVMTGPMMGNMRAGQNCTALRIKFQETQSLPTHQYRVLESCLYYFIRNRADTQLGFDAISAEAPLDKDGKVKLTFLGGSLEKLESHLDRNVRIRAYVDVKISLSWIDPRLKWEAKESGLESIHVHSASHIWVPDEDAMFGDWVSRRPSTQGAFSNILLQRSGNVTADWTTALVDYTACTIDYTLFPDDQIECNFLVGSDLYSDILMYEGISSARLSTAPHTSFGEWTPKVFEVSDASTSGGSGLAFRLVAERQSASLRFELSMPIQMSVAIVVASFFCSTMQFQLGLKCFAILIQFLAFQMMATRSPQLAVTQNVPHIYRYYEGVLITTIITVFVALVIFGLILNSPFKYPPPHRLSLVAGAVNRVLFWGLRPSTIHKPAPSSELPNGNAGGAESSSDWVNVWIALSNVLNVLFVVVYIAWNAVF